MKLLADNATYTADVIGHTDDVRGDGVQRQSELAARRKWCAASWWRQGTALNRFSFIGLGEDRATSTSVAGRAQDRYVHVGVALRIDGPLVAQHPRWCPRSGSEVPFPLPPSTV